MPLYDYKCAACKHIVEVRHGFNDVYDGVCPACGGALNRVFNPAPIVFKGSGFYVTDSRGGSREAKTTAEAGSDSKGDAKAAPASETKTETKSDAKTEGKSTSSPKESSDSAA